MEKEIQTVEEIRKTIELLNAQLGEAPYKLDYVDPKSIKLLEKNARYMEHEMFMNLVENVKRDGALTSLPLCYQDNDRLIVLSGNHRVQAAVHAGIKGIMIILINKDLSREEQVAVQLSHNAIEGKDDPVILKELWNEIEDIDLKLYAGLDSEIIQELENMEFVTISETSPDFKQVILTFLPEEIDQLKKLMEDADILFSADENFILSRKHYETVFELLLQVKEKFSIVNNPTALLKIIDIAKDRMAEQDTPGNQE